ELVTFHRRRATPDGLRLVVVGDVEPARVEDLVDRAFGDWRAEAAGAGVPPRVAPAPERRETRHVIAGKPQADIAYGFTTITRDDPRYYALTLMNNVLGQY